MDDVRQVLERAAAAASGSAQPDFEDVLRREDERAHRRRALAVLCATGCATALAVGLAVSQPWAGEPDRIPIPGASTSIGSDGASAQPAEIHGVVQLVGGPKGTPPRGAPAAVSAVGRNGKPVTVDTDADGRFTVLLAPGEWTISALSPNYLDGQAPCVVVVTVPTSGEVVVPCVMR